MNQSTKSSRGVHLRALSVVLSSALLFAMNVQAEQSAMTRHVRQQVASGQALFLHPLSATESLRLNIALPLRNEAELNNVMKDLYDPHSPFFHQFLSVEEFTDRFGPTEEDYAEVVRFAEQNGLIGHQHVAESDAFECRGVSREYRESLPGKDGRLSAPDGTAHLLLAGP